MSEAKFIVSHPAGLHARPASVFVKTCNSFPCDIKVKNVTTNSALVNAKSILSVLTLGVDSGHEILINASGEKEADVIAAIQELINTNFGENV
ncbi:MAG: HPr family phosphocarrier protein [Leptolinea sp.]|nr:HPr family phosphocarrier protein [Leptolinea sp.]